jgi:hypothetical protein
MSKKYFLFDDTIEEYCLIAVHCDLDDFSLAYVLNKNLRANFKRIKKSLNFNNSTFEIFHWESIKKGVSCSLVSNKNFVDSKINIDPSFLFNLSETKKVSLINSLPNVDYLIKVKQGLEINKTIKLLNEIPQLILSYIIENKEIKSNFNLILD